MSNIYVQEPPTSGKVVLKTSYGELDIELWTKETPRACRNFIQLCLEGYYDNTIFHRMVPGFMIQGGDPTGTGTGGESIYGRPFIDEFHQRLKFSHRGIVAMANSKANDNGSQFFITFDGAPFLDKKHTVFGRVVGDTQYNLMAMQNIEVQDERPVNPPKILSTKVLINPFDDITVRQAKKKEEKKAQAKSTKEKEDTALLGKRKAVKNINLLSFGDEEDIKELEADKDAKNHEHKILSSHDALDDPHLLKQPIVSKEDLEKKQRLKEENELKKKDLKSKITMAHEGKAPDGETEMTFDEQMRKNLQSKKRKLEKDDPNLTNLIAENDSELHGLKMVRNKKTGRMEIQLEKESTES